MISLLWSVLCVVLVCVVPVLAQTQSDISGVIHDASGAVIPGVSITVTNPATNFARSVISNEAGVYNFPGLQPGRYNIKVELAGFRTITQNPYVLGNIYRRRTPYSLEYLLNVSARSGTIRPLKSVTSAR
jgi:hypothetical protein